MTTPFPDPQATTLRPKSAEAALEESERQYREMVNRAPIGIYRSTRDGRLLTANPAMARMLGYQSVEDLLRVRLADVYRDPHQRDEIVAAFARAGTSADLELEWKRTDGRTIWVQVNAHAVLNTDDGSICFESFVRDITERKLVEQELRQSEERLRLVARATNDAVWDWDLMKNVLWLGDGFRTLFRLERGEFQAGIGSWAELVHPQDRDRVLSGLYRVLGRGGQFWSDEYRFRRGDGTYAQVYDRGYVLQDAKAQPVRMVGSVMDITERKKAEEEIRAHREQLSALSQRLLEVQETERRYLARELHDEVGQLLTASKLTFQAAQRARSPATKGTLLREGLTLLDQCLHQVRSLSLELRPSLLDDLGLAAALRWYMERQAERAGFAARLEDQLQERRLPANVETTCFRVAQEAITIVARHARASHLQVVLGERDGLLSLLVRDDGVGFDVEVARARASAGGSLGLLGMEERVALVGGRLRVDSRPGHGTEVQVELPLVSAISPPQAA